MQKLTSKRPVILTLKHRRDDFNVSNDFHILSDSLGISGTSNASKIESDHSATEVNYTANDKINCRSSPPSAAMFRQNQHNSYQSRDDKLGCSA